MTNRTTSRIATTIGLDVGDRVTHFCAIDSARETVERGSFPTTLSALLKQLGKFPGTNTVLEAGSQSPWMSRALRTQGFGRCQHSSSLIRVHQAASEVA